MPIIERDTANQYDNQQEPADEHADRAHCQPVPERSGFSIGDEPIIALNDDKAETRLASIYEGLTIRFHRRTYASGFPFATLAARGKPFFVKLVFRISTIT